MTISYRNTLKVDLNLPSKSRKGLLQIRNLKNKEGQKDGTGEKCRKNASPEPIRQADFAETGRRYGANVETIRAKDADVSVRSGRFSTGNGLPKRRTRSFYSRRTSAEVLKNGVKYWYSKR